MPNGNETWVFYGRGGASQIGWSSENTAKGLRPIPVPNSRRELPSGVTPAAARLFWTAPDTSRTPRDSSESGSGRSDRTWYFKNFQQVSQALGMSSRGLTRVGPPLPGGIELLRPIRLPGTHTRGRVTYSNGTFVMPDGVVFEPSVSDSDLAVAVHSVFDTRRGGAVVDGAATFGAYDGRERFRTNGGIANSELERTLCEADERLGAVVFGVARGVVTKLTVSSYRNPIVARTERYRGAAHDLIAMHLDFARVGCGVTARISRDAHFAVRDNRLVENDFILDIDVWGGPYQGWDGQEVFADTGKVIHLEEERRAAEDLRTHFGDYARELPALASMHRLARLFGFLIAVREAGMILDRSMLPTMALESTTSEDNELPLTFLSAPDPDDAATLGAHDNARLKLLVDNVLPATPSDRRAVVTAGVAELAADAGRPVEALRVPWTEHPGSGHVDDTWRARWHRARARAFGMLAERVQRVPGILGFIRKGAVRAGHRELQDAAAVHHRLEDARGLSDDYAVWMRLATAEDPVARAAWQGSGPASDAVYTRYPLARTIAAVGEHAATYAQVPSHARLGLLLFDDAASLASLGKSSFDAIGLFEQAQLFYRYAEPGATFESRLELIETAKRGSDPGAGLYRLYADAMARLEVLPEASFEYGRTADLAVVYLTANELATIAHRAGEDEHGARWSERSRQARELACQHKPRSSSSEKLDLWIASQCTSLM